MKYCITPHTKDIRFLIQGIGENINPATCVDVI
jgi:hypothetical protein